MGRFDVWSTKWDSRVTRKLIKFDLFCFKLFPQVVQKHQLGEMSNKMTPSSCIFSEIFYQKLLKSNIVWASYYGWWKTGMFYFDSRCHKLMVARLEIVCEFQCCCFLRICCWRKERANHSSVHHDHPQHVWALSLTCAKVNYRRNWFVESGVFRESGFSARVCCII